MMPIIQTTRCKNFPNLLLDVCVRLNMFRAYQPLVLLLERGGSSAVGRGRAGRQEHDQRHCYHRAPTVKSEADTAVVELLMMGVRTPETC
jgi:hypothetical protein